MFSLFFDKRIGFFPHTLLLIFVIRKDWQDIKVLLRITMKQLRESLASYTFLIPCHRAFLVNLNFVASISGRPSTGCILQMFQVEKTIPVARAYTKEIHDRLQSANLCS